MMRKNMTKEKGYKKSIRAVMDAENSKEPYRPPDKNSNSQGKGKHKKKEGTPKVCS